jgi:peptidoglycan/xylan/chitin deacetylase (PgdA/CDA1 family)
MDIESLTWVYAGEEGNDASVGIPTEPGGTGWSKRMINICFHGIGTPQRELEPGEELYWIGVPEFLRILDDLLEWPAVRISFDDGNSSDVTVALPALTERGLTADFFVLAGRLDDPGSLDRDDVRELCRHGMAVGSHGMAHRSWRGMDPATREQELVVARARLAAVTGARIETAACPLGRYDRQVLAHLRRLGYAKVFTSDRRRARSQAWLQPRYSVRRHDTPQSLHAEALARPMSIRGARASLVGVAKRLR